MFTNITKRMVKTPKVYFRDSGLLCFLLNLTEQSVLASPFLGAVWETIVFSELRKLNAALAEPVNFWYYRDQRSREIDFILEAGGKLSFVEAKWQEQPGKRVANTMLEISQELDHGQTQWRSGPHFIVGTPSNRFSVTEGIDATGVNDIPAILAEVIGHSRRSEH